jgi:NTE family protein
VIRDVISQIIPEDKSFSDLKIPFFCIATDILTAEEVLLKDGNLLEAVLASSSIPGIFEPVRMGKRFLVDGGITSLVPSLAAKRLGGDFIIGVNVEGLRLRDDFRSGMDILFQADQIMAHHLNKRNLSECDFVIQPKVSHLSWADFSKAQYCIEKGSQETERIFPELEKAIQKKRFKTFFKRLLRRDN